MSNQNSNQTGNPPEEFSFEWNGGFSYLTYLKKKSTVTVTDQHLHIKAQNFLLGIFPTHPRITELPLTHVRGLSIASKINWFDLVFSILFVIVTLITMSFWPLVLTIVFILCTFNTSIYITDHLGNRIEIPSGSKSAAVQFVQRVAQVTNPFAETASTVEHAAHPSITKPILLTKESSKISNGNPLSLPSDSPVRSDQQADDRLSSRLHSDLLVQFKRPKLTKTIFLVVSAALVALSILYVGILSRGGFDNQYVKWVKEGKVPESTISMSQVLENKNFFSNVEWEQIGYGKNDLDKYVMYQATYSVQGVKVFIRTVFQVFGKDHFQAIEFSADGQILEVSDWYDFLSSVTPKDNSTAAPKAVPTKPAENKQQPKTAPMQEPINQPNNASVPATNEPSSVTKVVMLKDFVKWTPSTVNATLLLNLDGEKMNLVVGYDTPNGIKLQLQGKTENWNLRLKDGNNAFNNYGDLKEGFNLYIKDHSFDNKSTPEVVVVASNGMMETYVWVFSYNFVYYEKSGAAPLEQIWFGEGQSTVMLDGNKIVLPFGSQGLSAEYVYDNLTFKEKQR
ncbi:hypothetical protein SAMN03159341_12263 [Paenibacillus sp. 1_12]|uniref:hypothetical protein n=1 Tax=Paenibacillus sp. 1_12 TaxID=1566278 RepID=UPI0008ECDFB0|nr:hypothetical protein [Paenibacillus sp. 1_12]SFM25354.1 hypothetical protein SAMN03159341_12263 [Paenibacillus sp. 1_12]